LVKMEGGAVHQGESAMQRLGAKNGMVDCMIWWHIKRDIFEMPVLVCMSVSSRTSARISMMHAI
jgi:hypothetical protein